MPITFNVFVMGLSVFRGLVGVAGEDLDAFEKDQLSAGVASVPAGDAMASFGSVRSGVLANDVIVAGSVYKYMPPVFLDARIEEAAGIDPVMKEILLAANEQDDLENPPLSLAEIAEIKRDLQRMEIQRTQYETKLEVALAYQKADNVLHGGRDRTGRFVDNLPVQKQNIMPLLAKPSTGVDAVKHSIDRSIYFALAGVQDPEQSGNV